MGSTKCYVWGAKFSEKTLIITPNSHISLQNIKSVLSNSNHIIFLAYHISTYIYFIIEVIFLNNLDMSNLLKMLSKMDKKDLEQGLAKANEILKTKNKNEILNEITKNNLK